MHHTTIISNGSKWLGQSPDPLDVLFDVLGRHDLDPRIFSCERTGDGCRFFGNFVDRSHVFNLHTDDPGTVRRLRGLCAASLLRSWRKHWRPVTI